MERYGLVPDSGGAGRHRGGLAYVREYTVLAERATLTIRTDRRDHPPYGLDGGEPGAPSANVIVSNGEERELPTMPMEASLLERGDGFTHVSAGGGGFGDPFERDPAAVLEDVLDEKVSFAAARERYGVVIADGPRRRRRDAGSEGLPMIELAIRNGLVVDGTGAAPRPADVGIEGGPIVLVGEVPEAEREIDASGKVVAPGFIDIHSHSDFTLLVDPRAASAVHQGVTTEVVGNCGFGCFPLLNKELAPKAIYGHSDEVPLTLDDGRRVLRAARGGRAGDQRGEPRAQRADPALGRGPRGSPCTPDELERMRYLLDEALEQGAWGYSTGLEYAAERGADEDELVAMCEVCGRRHGIYATHTRRRDEGADEAVAEALRTSERSGVRLQVSHLVPRNGIESARRCVELVDAAAAAGMDVAFDMHTRLYGTTFLLAALPPSALEDPARLRETLGSPRAATRVAELREHPQRRRRLESDRPSRQRRLARVRAARRGVDRRRAQPGFARRRLRPAARSCRRSRAADGDHPCLHRGAAARGVRPPALRAGLRRDDDGARTGRSRGRCSTGPTPGRRGTSASASSRSTCSPWPRPCTG